MRTIIKLHEENKGASVWMGTAGGLGSCFSMAAECVSDKCERWASGVEHGSKREASRPVEIG